MQWKESLWVVVVKNGVIALVQNSKTGVSQ